MAKRSYKQYCSLARALDVVGERWTLLVLRELLSGPKRFKDLQEGLPGIGTGLLASRLKELEGYGLIQRATLPPPAGSSVYELTGVGRELEPVIVGLMRWGLRWFDKPRRGEVFRASWLVHGMRARFDPEAARGVRETYEFRVDDEVYTVRVEDGSAEVRQGAAERPDASMTTDTKTFVALISGELKLEPAVAAGRVELHGDLDALKRSGEIFRTPVAA